MLQEGKVTHLPPAIPRAARSFVGWLLVVAAAASGNTYAAVFSWADLMVYGYGGYRVGESDFTTTEVVTYNAKEVGFGLHIAPVRFQWLAASGGLFGNVQVYEVEQATHRLNDLYGYQFGPQLVVAMPSARYYPYIRVSYVYGGKSGTGRKGAATIDAAYSAAGVSMAFGYKLRLWDIAALFLEYDVRAETVTPTSVSAGSRDITNFFPKADYDSAGYMLGGEWTL